MVTIPIENEPDGTAHASALIPPDAICTITTPDGCDVYMPGDEEALATRFASLDLQLAGE